LIEKHRSKADPQDDMIMVKKGEQTTGTGTLVKRNVMSEEMKVKVCGDIKKMCFEVSPSEIKIMETSEGVKVIMEKQNEIIKKLTGGETSGDQMMDLTKEIAEKLKHTMFMI
jgi:hypothetical protein